MQFKLFKTARIGMRVSYWIIRFNSLAGAVHVQPSLSL